MLIDDQLILDTNQNQCTVIPREFIILAKLPPLMILDPDRNIQNPTIQELQRLISQQEKHYLMTQRHRAQASNNLIHQANMIQSKFNQRIQEILSVSVNQSFEQIDFQRIGMENMEKIQLMKLQHLKASNEAELQKLEIKERNKLEKLKLTNEKQLKWYQMNQNAKIEEINTRQDKRLQQLKMKYEKELKSQKMIQDTRIEQIKIQKEQAMQYFKNLFDHAFSVRQVEISQRKGVINAQIRTMKAESKIRRRILAKELQTSQVKLRYFNMKLNIQRAGMCNSSGSESSGKSDSYFRQQMIQIKQDNHIRPQQIISEQSDSFHSSNSQRQSLALDSEFNHSIQKIDSPNQIPNIELQSLNIELQSLNIELQPEYNQQPKYIRDMEGKYKKKAEQLQRENSNFFVRNNKDVLPKREIVSESSQEGEIEQKVSASLDSSNPIV